MTTPTDKDLDDEYVPSTTRTPAAKEAPRRSSSVSDSHGHQASSQKDRKEKNRLAASRCREKKRNQISHLEESLAEANQRNAILKASIAALTTTLNKLKHELHLHQTHHQ